VNLATHGSVTADVLIAAVRPTHNKAGSTTATGRVLSVTTGRKPAPRLQRLLYGAELEEASECSVP